jgi:hypothetical protein
MYSITTDDPFNALPRAGENLFIDCHSIHKNDLARAMVAQSEQAFLALEQGKGPAAPAVKILEYKEMEPFFVTGDSDGP